MTPESIAQAVATVAAPVFTAAGLASRKRRLRGSIRDNLALVEDIRKNELLAEHTPALAWLNGRIAIDVAKLSDQPLGAAKKPIDKGALITAFLLAVAFGAWTYLIDRDVFVWYSVFPGILSFLAVISFFGMFTNREIPADQSEEIPPGATLVRNDAQNEQIATSLMLATEMDLDKRFSEDGQIGISFRFLRAMREGRYSDGIRLADKNWLTCRIQSWLWNNREEYGSNTTELDQFLASLLNNQSPSDIWDVFVASEMHQFAETWSGYNSDKMGAASNRRRIARDYDIVVLAPVGEHGGYFVMNATIVNNALVFVLHRQGDTWLIANHVGHAAPIPGWPPTWWSPNDPAIEALPE